VIVADPMPIKINRNLGMLLLAIWLLPQAVESDAHRNL
jgi:hypothetical protein